MAPHTKTLAAGDLPLAGRDIALNPGVKAGDYAAALLRSLGADTPAPSPLGALEIAGDWAASGLIPLTGSPDAPMQGPAAIPSAAHGALAALKLLAGGNDLQGLDGASLLSERAAFPGLSRQGRVSANGSCHLLRARDGWLALNLARDDDWALLPAWLEAALDLPCWQQLAERVAQRDISRLLERGRTLGLPVACARPENRRADSWFSLASRGPGGAGGRSGPLVVDLSSLWAGPLCTHLLGLAGARVIKVESAGRLDGARGGDTDFYNLLNANKESVVLDLASTQGRQQLACLLARADIVVEGSRPRALRQLGIEAEQLVRSVPGLTWISITGYGRGEPEANWVAFGDDAAVAAGVAIATADPPVFCGDALADPLTGIHAAVAAQAFWQSGAGGLLDLSLRGVTAYSLNYHPGVPRGKVLASSGGWRLLLQGESFPLIPPQRRRPASSAAPPGSDTQRVLTEFAIPC
ncbi:CoA transferase [Seongchinamella sediminis]|nr:CoA transferase [Seongchinamella sediminis]